MNNDTTVAVGVVNINIVSKHGAVDMEVCEKAARDGKESCGGEEGRERVVIAIPYRCIRDSQTNMADLLDGFSFSRVRGTRLANR